MSAFRVFFSALDLSAHLLLSFSLSLFLCTNPIYTSTSEEAASNTAYVYAN